MLNGNSRGKQMKVYYKCYLKYVMHQSTRCTKVCDAPKYAMHPRPSFSKLVPDGTRVDAHAILLMSGEQVKTE